MTAFDITICQLPDDPDAFEVAWSALIARLERRPADLLVLNEVPFDAWFGATPTFDERTWSSAIARHRDRLRKLDHLPVAVLGTAPYEYRGKRYNRAFLRQAGEQQIGWWRRKTWLPDEDPVFEASWYSAAHDPPDLRTVADCQLSVLTCTELWAMDWVKQIGMMGAHVIASPRATGLGSTENWLAAGRVAAITSGCYSVSSNRCGNGFGGTGWVFAPDGECLATTTDDQPSVTVQVDLRRAEQAKLTYPRYALWTRRWLS
ncbi:MAG: carbon-nitrogen hydrolase family protein [Nakamurella sp.]